MAVRITSPSQDSGTPVRTLSGEPVGELYTEADLPAGIGGPDDPIGRPGAYPFTRGVYESMYRGRLWTMRQFAGFGTSEETNARFRYLLDHGQTGLSTAFDMPSLMGHDSDYARSLGEVGREGVAIDTTADMRTLFGGIDLGAVSVSMTINAPAAIMLAFYVAAAEQPAGGAAPVPAQQLSGTIQADILKEYMAQKEYCFPIGPSVRICRDCITYCAENMRRYNPINISGYHISEAGASPLQEAAFTLANGIVYVEEVLKTGMGVDTFAPRLAFYFVSQADFFEEIAKFRAVRRVWAKIMKTRFGARNQDSMRLRFHCQTAAATLTKPQYRINVVRTALQALSAVLGGCQSLHTNGYDEAFAIPTEDAMRLALRTQQIIAEEINISSVVDPLGGSYFLESLTSDYEKRMFEILDYVDANGGAIKLIEDSWFQKQIADFAYATALRKQSGEKPVIGVNRFIDEEEVHDIETHPYDPRTAERQIARTRRIRAERDAARHTALMEKLVAVAKDGRQNIMPITIEAVENGATMGEVVDALKKLWGTYRETPVF
jgi:methylmalonyl-CoA mutase N-terminal domain/subunit